jgi:hypothetical protein
MGAAVSALLDWMFPKALEAKGGNAAVAPASPAAPAPAPGGRADAGRTQEGTAVGLRPLAKPVVEWMAAKATPGALLYAWRPALGMRGFPAMRGGAPGNGSQAN